MKTLIQMQNNLRLIGEAKAQSINELKKRIEIGEQFVKNNPLHAVAIERLEILKGILEKKMKWQPTQPIVKEVDKQYIDKFFDDLANNVV